MTALKKYQKLESTGLWREAPEGQRREVVVAFGDASLILSDPRTGSPLSHWSLPAVARLNPGETPAVFGPDASVEQTESLEVDDPTMIGAIETVRGAIAQARARPGRLRNAILGAAVLVGLMAAVFWLPPALIARTAAMVPDVKRAEIGRLALADVTRVSGLPCNAPLGLQAAARLSDRVLGPDGGDILILRDGPRRSAHLPGNLILLSKGLVEQEDGPTLAASFALAERAKSGAADPLVPLLAHAGLLATLRLLTTGTLPESSVTGYAETMLGAPPPVVPDEILLQAFRDAGLPSTPFAYALDPSGETVLGLIEADPFRGTEPPPVLPDGDWISLQAICQPG